VPIECDLSDIVSVRRAAEQIIELRFPIAGLVNNAGIYQMRPTKQCARLGYDLCDKPSRTVCADGSADESCRASP